MKKALKNLFDNPQNNMNIFSIENSAVENVSTTNFKEYFKSSNNINNYENIINHLTNILMSNKSQILLKQIYNIQAMDDFDIEGLVKLKLPTFALNTANALNFKVDNIINDVNNDGIDKTFGKIGSMNINSIINEKIKEDDDHDNNNVLSNSEKIKIIRRFLLSKTAKDLSLVITTIYPIDSETVNANELETLPFSIKIIDTDFKPIDKFNEWIQKDLNIMNAYFEEKQGK